MAYDNTLSLVYKRLGEICKDLKPRLFSSGAVLKAEWTVEESKAVLTIDTVSKNARLKIERTEGTDTLVNFPGSHFENCCIKKFYEGLGTHIPTAYNIDLRETKAGTVVKPLIYPDREAFVGRLKPFLEKLRAFHQTFRIKNIDINYNKLKIAKMKGYLNKTCKRKNPEVVNKYIMEIARLEKEIYG